jgi:hypothetical protein
MNISDEDRAWIDGDSKRFFEMALRRAETWEEGFKYAKELRSLQHPSISSISATNEDKVIELRWME